MLIQKISPFFIKLFCKRGRKAGNCTVKISLSHRVFIVYFYKGYCRILRISEPGIWIFMIKNFFCVFSLVFAGKFIPKSIAMLILPVCNFVQILWKLVLFIRPYSAPGKKIDICVNSSFFQFIKKLIETFKSCFVKVKVFPGFIMSEKAFSPVRICMMETNAVIALSCNCFCPVFSIFYRRKA